MWFCMTGSQNKRFKLGDRVRYKPEVDEGFNVGYDPAWSDMVILQEWDASGTGYYVAYKGSHHAYSAKGTIIMGNWFWTRDLELIAPKSFLSSAKLILVNTK